MGSQLYCKLWAGRTQDPHPCKSILEPVKNEIHKLTKLKSTKLSIERVLKKTRKYLCAIGKHIEETVKKGSSITALMCWEYVSLYACTTSSAQKYMEMYNVIKREQATKSTPVHKNLPVSATDPNQKTVQKINPAGFPQAPPAISGGKRKAVDALTDRDKPSKALEKRPRSRYSPDPNAPSTVCRSVKDYMRLFGDDQDHLMRLEEVNSKAYQRR